MRTFFIAAFSFLPLGISALADPPAPLPTLSPAMKADLEAMQERVPSPHRPEGKVATAKAIGAASRVFAGLPLVGLTKDQVVAILGPPTEAIAATATMPGRLTYTFDNGPAGRQFLLAVDQKGRITGVTSQHYD